MEFTSDNFDAMKTIERAVIATLMPFRSRFPNGAAVFALVRCARVLLRLSPEKVQAEMLAAVIPYLEGKTKPREVTTPNGLYLAN